MISTDFKTYIELSERFLDGQIRADAFCREFIRLFKAERRPMDEATFEVLNRLFTACDCYDPSVEGDEVSVLRLDERSLRAEVAASLQREVHA